ncbi:MAG: hypothetical protein KBT11_11345 [Treponema sp.]|nr:hypothetical protein [Candidatus Treponema equifaecale]
MKKISKFLAAAVLAFSTLTGFATAKDKIPEHFIWKEPKWKPTVNASGTYEVWWRTQNDKWVKFHCSNDNNIGRQSWCSDHDTRKHYGFEGTVKKISGNTSAGLGFTFSGEFTSEGKFIHGYTLFVNPNGFYNLREDEKGVQRIIQKWTKNPAIKTGLNAENVIKTQYTRAGNIEVYINNTLVNTIENPKFINGTVHFATQIHKNDIPSQTAVENLYKLNKVYSEAKGKKEIAAAIQQEEELKAAVQQEESKDPEWVPADWNPSILPDSTDTEAYWMKDGENTIIFKCNKDSALGTAKCQELYPEKVHGFEVTYSKESGRNNGIIMFHFALDSNLKNGYVISVRPTGEAAVWTFSDPNTYNTIQKWDTIDAYKTGLKKENTLKCMFVNGNWEIYFNDGLFYTIENAEYKEGYFRLANEIIEKEEPAKVPVINNYKFLRFYK